MTFRKYQCWKPERIGRVIAKAALDVDRATFLATHMSMRDIVYEKSPLQIPHTSEQDFLNELNRMAREDSHVFTVVKGIPGTGKSHLIRWLYERYRQDHSNDRVLLIERANTSLKKTIQQIIESGIFESRSLSEQLKQLKNAADALSRDGLADTLLGHLLVATNEVEWDEQLHQRIAKEKIYSFLLDKTVREHLKRDNGPIDRVVRYLQEGQGIERSETPGFEPDDLILSPHQRGIIRQEGYREVGDVADDINRENTKQRDQLTRYLNFLLKAYAIGRTTNLAAADLRDMFNDLRRTLLKEGQNLALFIEDITAFTGIDAGLIDVLITQHTGGDNKQFCRLTSVIGITDGYFTDSIPANIRERISHQLTLSARSGRGESDMLQQEATLVEFVAHYLNAIRLDAQVLERWEQDNPILSSLPNACTACSHRIACHRAFGSVNITSEEADVNQQVGLYPFNATALTRMYNNLESNIFRTPRVLLDNILAFILQSHGDKVGKGKFPPSADTLAPKIDLQEFDPTSHGRIVEQQGKYDADRLKTLFLFWGNRNVSRDGNTIGGLTSDIFTAFDLLEIEGRIPESNIQTAPKAILPEVVMESSATEQIVQPQKTIKRQSEYTDDISRWFTGGYLASQSANKLLQWLTEVFLGIDWQAYNIPPSRIPSPNQASSYFALEGQAARIEQNQLVFIRSSELRYALEAVANFNDKNVELEPAQYGEYLAALDTWVRREEVRIVNFIRVRTQQNLPYEMLPRLLMQEAVLLACLSGKLSNYNSVIELYAQVIATCSGTQEIHDKYWDELSKIKHPAIWSKLVGSLRNNRSGAIVLEAALRQFNAPQGDGKELRFLHAGPIFQILSEFEESDWGLEEVSGELRSDSGQPEWDSALRVHKILHNQFHQAIQEAFEDLKQISDRLALHIGNKNINLIFNEMYELLQDMQSANPTDPNLRSELYSLKPEELQRLIKKTSYAIEYQTVIQKATFLSHGYQEYIIPLKRYVDYFDRFAIGMELVQKTLQTNRGKLKETQEAENLLASTTEQYDELIGQLSVILTIQDKKI